MLLQIKNAPIAIEPGVPAIEVEMCMTMHGVRRDFPAQLSRVPVDRKAAKHLPFLVDTKNCHVFSVTEDLTESTLLMQYEAGGKIHAIYTKDETGKTWERREIPDEYSGKTIKQFSVRYFFPNESVRDEFMAQIDAILLAIRENRSPPPSNMHYAFKMLAKSRVGPVVLPVHVPAVEQKQKV
jgi:hypothetical protein